VGKQVLAKLVDGCEHPLFWLTYQGDSLINQRIDIGTSFLPLTPDRKASFIQAMVTWPARWCSSNFVESHEEALLLLSILLSRQSLLE